MPIVIDQPRWEWHPFFTFTNAKKDRADSGKMASPNSQTIPLQNYLQRINLALHSFPIFQQLIQFVLFLFVGGKKLRILDVFVVVGR